MNSQWKLLWQDERGFILTAELVLILTIGVLAMIVGLNGVAKSVTQELNDVSGAIGALDQSYAYRGMNKSWHAGVVGSAYADRGDACDCSSITSTAAGMKIDNGYQPECASSGAIPQAVPHSVPQAVPHAVPHGPALPAPQAAPCNGCEPVPAPCTDCHESTTPLDPTPDSVPMNETPKKAQPKKRDSEHKSEKKPNLAPAASAVDVLPAGPRLTSGHSV